MDHISKWPIYAHILSAIFCMGCSACFHLFYVKSIKWLDFLAKLDYAGICILICGSTMPANVYYFACNGSLCTITLKIYILVWRQVFIVTITTFCTICFFIAILPSFDGPNGRKLRGILFALTGVSAALPMVFLFNFRDPVNMMDPDF